MTDKRERTKEERTKEELMKQVFGKRRDFGLSFESLKSQSDEISKRLDEIQARRISEEANDSLLKTLAENQRTLESFSGEPDLKDLKAQIAKDFGIADVTEKTLCCDWIPKDAAEIPGLLSDLSEKVSAFVSGQEEAVRDLLEGVLRPYIRERAKEDLRNAVFVGGPSGSGRHYLVETVVNGIRGVLLSDPSSVSLDLSEYRDASKEGLFVQDMYSALSGSAQFVLISNFEAAHVGVNNMLGELISEGKMKLSKRYVQKNGALQEDEKTLRTDVTREIRGNGKILILISEKNKGILTDVYGKTVADSVIDVVFTKPFEGEVLKRVIERRLSEFQKELEEVGRSEVRIDPSVSLYLFEQYDPFTGLHGIFGELEELFGRVTSGILSRMGKDLTLVYDGGFQAHYPDEILDLSDDDDALSAIKEEIRGIVGLDEVKTYLYSLEHLVKAGTKRRKMGLKADAVTRHMIFTGNPGTGKTTVARLVSKLMKAIGALEQGHLVEVTRADLVGRYVGHTAPLTDQVIKSALGGVLFIDEAYSLYRGKDDSFGLEAIDTLVKGMEDNRDRLMVILAGYSHEMEVFLTSNSGLKSRFPKTVHFSDYDAEELVRIAYSVAKKKDYVIADDVREDLKAFLGTRNLTEKSNGRLVRNVVEAAMIRQSGRLTGSESAEEMKILKREDFCFDFDIK